MTGVGARATLPLLALEPDSGPQLRGFIPRSELCSGVGAAPFPPAAFLSFFQMFFKSVFVTSSSVIV